MVGLRVRLMNGQKGRQLDGVVDRQQSVGWSDGWMNVRLDIWLGCWTNR